MSSPTHRTRTLATISGLALLMGAGLAGAPQAAHAQSQQQSAAQHDINLPAGPLEASLVRLADVTGVQLVYSAQVSSGIRAPAVRGRMDAATAFARVLAGSGLTYRFIDARTVTIERIPQSVEDDGSRVLGPVRVEGAQSLYSGPPIRGEGIAQLGGARGEQDGEATGYRANVATIGAGAQTAIEDIPRSISVVTQDQIQSQDIQTVGDALRRLPGVVIIDNAGDRNTLGQGALVSSRTFAISQVQIDGGAALPLNMVGNSGADMTAYERVELIRGPNGLFSSAGSPGGNLNLVRKRPGRDEEMAITALLGGYERARVELDFSTPEFLGSNFAFRGVASIESRDYWYDRASTDSITLYGILDAPLGDKARVEIGAQYNNREDDSPYAGAFRYLDGPLIDFGGYHTNLQPDWAYDDSNQVEFFGRLYVDLLDDVDLQVGFDIQRQEQERLTAAFTPFFLSDGNPLGTDIGASYGEFERSTYSGNFRLTGKKSFWGLDHNFYLSGDLTAFDIGSSNSRYAPNRAFVTTPQEFLDALATYEPTLSAPFGVNPGGTARQYGLVVGDVISWRDFLELSIGARKNVYSESMVQIYADQQSGIAYYVDLPEVRDGGEKRSNDDWTPTWSLAIKPLANLTLYGTAAEGTDQRATPYYSPDGDLLPPTTYQSMEIGAKYSRETWLASLSYYDIEQKDVAEALPGTSCPPSNGPFTPCYEGGRATRVRGIDFEISGEVAPGLNVIATYAHMDADNAILGANPQTTAPVDTASWFIDWTPMTSSRWSFRGGARYRGEVYQAGSIFLWDPNLGYAGIEKPFTFSERPFVVFDAGVQYQLTEDVSLDLFIKNLTDEEYIEAIRTPRNPNMPGEARNFSLTLRWKKSRTHLNGGGLAPFGEPWKWYAAVDAGWHSASDIDATAEGVGMDGATRVNWDFDTTMGPLLSGRVGYRFTPQVRGEIEATYRQSEMGRISGSTVAPFGVCGAENTGYLEPFDCNDAVGDMDSWAVFANALYDFGGADQTVRPFVGVGLGVHRSALSFSGKMLGIGPDSTWGDGFGGADYVRSLQEAITGDSSDVNLAVQFLAGISWKLTDQATIEAGYRYLEVPNMQWESWNLEEPAFGVDPIVGRLGDFSGTYKDHAVTVGLRWSFGVH